MNAKINKKYQETIEDNELKDVVGKCEVQATSGSHSKTEAIQNFDDMPCVNKGKRGFKSNVQMQSVSGEDVLTTFDKSGRVLKRKRLEKDENCITNYKPFKRNEKPPTYLTKYPEDVLAIFTDANPYHGLSFKMVYKIKDEILKKIEALPAHVCFPRIKKSTVFYGYLLLFCKDDFTKEWIISNFEGNKNVIEGKSLVILKAKELPNPLVRINPPDSTNSDEEELKIKFVNPQCMSENNYIDDSDTKSILSTSSIEQQTPPHSSFEATSSGPRKKTKFTNKSRNEQQVIDPCFTEDEKMEDEDQESLGNESIMSNVDSGTNQAYNLGETSHHSDCDDDDDDIQILSSSQSVQTNLLRSDVVKKKKEYFVKVKQLTKLLKKLKSGKSLDSTILLPLNINVAEIENLCKPSEKNKEIFTKQDETNICSAEDHGTLETATLISNVPSSTNQAYNLDRTPNLSNCENKDTDIHGMRVSQDGKTKLTRSNIAKLRWKYLKEANLLNNLLKRGDLRNKRNNLLKSSKGLDYSSLQTKEKEMNIPCHSNIEQVSLGIEDIRNLLEESSKDDNCVTRVARWGLARSEISKLQREVQNKLKNFKNKYEYHKKTKNLSEPEIQKLKKEYLENLKHLEQLLRQLKREEKKEKVKTKKSLSKTNKASIVRETFDLSNPTHMKMILKHCVVTGNAEKKLSKEEQLEIKRKCIEKLDSFRVSFKIHHTNLDDTKRLLNLLVRFKPHLKCTNWQVLSKYMYKGTVKWIFILKRFDIEAIRKAKFVACTGVEQGSFEIMLGPHEVSKCQMISEQTPSSDELSNESKTTLSDGMNLEKASSEKTDSNTIYLSDDSSD